MSVFFTWVIETGVVQTRLTGFPIAEIFQKLFGRLKNLDLPLKILGMGLIMFYYDFIDLLRALNSRPATIPT